MELFPSFASYMMSPKTATAKTTQEALIDALRNYDAQSQAATPVQAGQVVNANAGVGGLQSGIRAGLGIGNQLNKLNFGTAFNYGTTPGSQQTALLAAQDAGF